MRAGQALSTECVTAELVDVLQQRGDKSFGDVPLLQQIGGVLSQSQVGRSERVGVFVMVQPRQGRDDGARYGLADWQADIALTVVGP